MPLFIGYGAKAALLQALPDKLGGLVGWLGIGTAVVLARLLPDQWQTVPVILRPASHKLLAPWFLVSLLVIGPSLLGETRPQCRNHQQKVCWLLARESLIERLLRQPLRSWTPDFERFSDVSVALGVTVVICQPLVNTPLPSLLPMS